ncbi:HD domain-containing protein [Lysinibacillus sp. FJAT-14745]|uniref:HD domain-containing protein n=1 Tax=Lysinibacillus sp. FJAT-14745 TaxID=1704289 RepID=UPI0006AB9B83|nr:HD domain-containing protein [Lysinibacillus sp. FJAT-14745]
MLKEEKRQNEILAIEKIRDMLGNDTGQQFYDLRFKFEHKDTYEAKVANALDKLEVQIQHNEAAIETWLPIEHEMTFLLGKHTDFYIVLTELKNLIEAEGAEKLRQAGF